MNRRQNAGMLGPAVGGAAVLVLRSFQSLSRFIRSAARRRHSPAVPKGAGVTNALAENQLLGDVASHPREDVL